MGVILHDLAVQDDVRLSPYCWRARFALEHKGLSYRTAATCFTGIASIADGKQKTVPVLEDGGRVVGDSWAIANYLEDTYPERPSLFGGEVGRAHALFLQNWVTTAVLRPSLKALVLDVYGSVQPQDRDYFRTSREQRFGMTLEEIAAGPQEERVAVVRTALEPLRLQLKEQPFLSGGNPMYADYVVAGTFMWWRGITRAQLLTREDPLTPWMERMLALYPAIAKESRRLWDGP
jgi:glutathione S-transferase